MSDYKRVFRNTMNDFLTTIAMGIMFFVGFQVGKSYTYERLKDNDL